MSFNLNQKLKPNAPLSSFPLTKQPSFKIPRVILPSPEVFLKQKMKDKYGLNDLKAEEAVLMKYYPKYYRCLFIDSSFRRKPALSKIKQVKTIQHFRYEIEKGSNEKKEHISKLVRNWLQTKRKSIRSPDLLLPSSWISPSQMNICHFFPRIKQLSTEIFASNLPETIRSLPSISPFSVQKRGLRLHQYFWSALLDLKHLTLIVSSNELWWLLLRRIQFVPRFLSSLETFHLKVNYSESNKGVQPEDFFRIILQNQGLLDHVTHITFYGDLDFRYYGDQIKFILVSCPKLIGVSFPIQERSPKNAEKTLIMPKNATCLNIPSLKTLHNVTMLKLQVDDFSNLTKFFQFPPHLESLSLYFSWKKEVAVDFFAKLRELAHLKFLQLFVDKPENYVVSNFLVPLLKSFPQLETFDCQFCPVKDTYGPVPDLSGLLDAATSLKQLKAFQICTDDRDGQNLVFTFSPRQNFVFPNIPLISIDAWLSPKFNFRDFVQSIQTSPAKREINLSRIMFSSNGAFRKLLTEFQSVGRLSPLQINLEIILRLSDLQDIVDTFGSLIYLPSNLAITLKIYFPTFYPPIRILPVVPLQKIFHGFKSVILKALTIKSNDPTFFDVRNIPLILNNIQQSQLELKKIKPSGSLHIGKYHNQKQLKEYH